MQEIEIEFLEEFRSLENLLGDIYSCKHGVSEYINLMETQEIAGRRKVPLWDYDCTTLKYLRRLRNSIVHDNYTYLICNDEDIEHIKNFHERILSGKDPLTLLRLVVKSETENRNQNRQVASQSSEYGDTFLENFREQHLQSQNNSYNNTERPHETTENNSQPSFYEPSDQEDNGYSYRSLIIGVSVTIAVIILFLLIVL